MTNEADEVVARLLPGVLDLREPISSSWFAEGGSVAGSDSLTRTVSFFITPGTTQIRRLWVRATDMDGLTAEDEITVRVTSTKPPGPRP